MLAATALLLLLDPPARSCRLGDPDYPLRARRPCMMQERVSSHTHGSSSSPLSPGASLMHSDSGAQPSAELALAATLFRAAAAAGGPLGLKPPWLHVLLHPVQPYCPPSAADHSAPLCAGCSLPETCSTPIGPIHVKQRAEARLIQAWPGPKTSRSESTLCVPAPDVLQPVNAEFFFTWRLVIERTVGKA